jgi:hypothetical protein
MNASRLPEKLCVDSRRNRVCIMLFKVLFITETIPPALLNSLIDTKKLAGSNRMFLYKPQAVRALTTFRLPYNLHSGVKEQLLIPHLCTFPAGPCFHAAVPIMPGRACFHWSWEVGVYRSESVADACLNWHQSTLLISHGCITWGHWHCGPKGETAVPPRLQARWKSLSRR